MLDWWVRRSRDGRVSLSMLALVLSLSGALVLGLTSWVPRVMARGIGIVDVEPGLLEVAQGARGVQSLGAGLSVSLFTSGFRLARGSEVLADTVTRGAPVSAMFGSVSEGGEHPRETMSGVLSTVRIDAVRRVGDVVEYIGVVRDSSTSRPLRIKFEPTDGSIRMDVLVPAVDALAIHLDWRPATTGIAPALPERNLRERAYWVDPTVIAQPAFTWVLGTDVTIGPVQVPRAVDLRQDGRIAVHVWAPRAVVTVTDTPRMP
ncbi:hypothetical protein GCM10023153_29850 [Ornithinibacter aureus]|uniref:DUF2993 domain-containing protein n=1 Tax=Ornithinibacter aureus TaxID=622664 RepID=A0ABP8K6M5_9MICO|nr:hypothetical protein [Ornithinibacter aureus]KAF0834928.1 hypothetical protein C8E84_2782 [Ornithinibacter aureus]